MRSRDVTDGAGGHRVDRRGFLRRGVGWVGWAVSLVLLLPLVKFARFRVQPKPRLIEVPAPLPLSGVHTHHDFLLFAADDGARAVSRTCTHLGCRVNYQQEKQYIECPCHQSRFTAEGKRFAGPAERDLATHEVSLKRDAEGRVTAYVVQL